MKVICLIRHDLFKEKEIVFVIQMKRDLCINMKFGIFSCSAQEAAGDSRQLFVQLHFITEHVDVKFWRQIFVLISLFSPRLLLKKR
jgi:hypothetical protein